MGVSEHLNAIRRDVPACRMVAFADLSANLVLESSAEQRLPQERLDALCTRARSLFGPHITGPAEALVAGPVARAVTSFAEGLLVIVRSAADPNEALICVCDRDADVSRLFSRASEALETIDTPG